METFDNADIKQVVYRVCKKLNEPPNDSNVRDVMQFVKRYNISFLKAKIQKKEDLYDHLSDAYTDAIFQKEDEDSRALQSTGDFIKNELYDESYMKFKNINRTDWANWNVTNVYIDSKYQNISNQDRTILDFSIVPKSNRSKKQTGSITSYSNLTNITEFEIGEFIIPYTSVTNYFREITLIFLDIPNNSIESNENSFHFKFTYEPCSFNANLVKLIPYLKRFRFNPPIKTLDSLRIQFADPYVPIEFNKDRMIPSGIDYSLVVGKFTFSEPHKLVTGDVVLIEGFQSVNSNENIEILKKINDVRGHVITVINSTSFSIDIAFNTIVNPLLVAFNKPIIYFQSKRIQFPIRIRYINNEDIF